MLSPRGLLDSRYRSAWRRAARAHAALLALAFALASLLGMAHEATTRHATCAEHGELVHAPARVARSERTTAASALRGAAPAALHGHDHCSINATTRASSHDLRRPAIARGPLAARDIARAPRTDALAPSLALYRTAPKTSPPA